jgi:hypothetical protein
MVQPQRPHRPSERNRTGRSPAARSNRRFATVPPSSRRPGQFRTSGASHRGFLRRRSRVTLVPNRFDGPVGFADSRRHFRADSEQHDPARPTPENVHGKPDQRESRYEGISWNTPASQYRPAPCHRPGPLRPGRDGRWPAPPQRDYRGISTWRLKGAGSARVARRSSVDDFGPASSTPAISMPDSDGARWWIVTLVRGLRGRPAIRGL